MGYILFPISQAKKTPNKRNRMRNLAAKGITGLKDHSFTEREREITGQ